MTFLSKYWQTLFNSIQFILYSPKSQIQICLWGLNSLYTYDIPVPGPHIGSGKTPPKKISGKTLSQGKKRGEETWGRATEEDPSPRMDRSNRCHVYRINVTELQHIQLMSQIIHVMSSRHGPRSRGPRSTTADRGRDEGHQQGRHDRQQDRIQTATIHGSLRRGSTEAPERK